MTSHNSRKHIYQWPAAQSFSLCGITTNDFNYIVALTQIAQANLRRKYLMNFGWKKKPK